MWDDQPDEAEKTYHGDGTRGKQSSDCREEDARALNGKPDAACHIIAELEDVEALRRRECEKPCHDGIRQEQFDVRPAPRGQSADHPHQCTVHAVAVENHHRGDARAEEGGHGDTCEDDARGADAVPPREDVDEERRKHRAAECRRGNEPRRTRHHEHDKDARKPRSGGDPDDVRVGKRVPEDRL